MESAAPGEGVERPRRRSSAYRRRLRRFIWVAHGVTLAVHAIPALALASILPTWVAIPLAVALWLATAGRLHVIALDRRRPRWVTRVIDVPMFWQWSGAFFGFLLLLPVSLVLALSGLWRDLPHASAVAYGASLTLCAYGVWWRRRRVVVREIDVAIEGLPAAFDGYRVVQLSDLHIGSFDGADRGAEWVRLALGARPDVVVVTGDLVTSGTAFSNDAANVLGSLTAPDGVFVVLGNHDQWDAHHLASAISARGPVVLANDWRSIGRGGQQLIIAGIDDRFSAKADLERTLAGRPPGATTLLLSHYPEYFEPAAKRDVALVLSGHTHGGQIGFGERWNLATLGRQRRRGLVRSRSTWLYVSAGLGTTGPPLRLGVAPEIAVLVLGCA